MSNETAVIDAVETDVDQKRKELEQIKCEIKEKKQELKKLDRREYSLKEQEITDKQISGQAKGNGLKEKIEKQKEKDNVMVTGRFINRHHPGKKSEKLTYLKYADDPVKWYDFEDGKVYTIPMGFVEQIKNHYYRPHFIQKQGPMDANRPASQIHDIDTTDNKYDFVPISF